MMDNMEIRPALVIMAAGIGSRFGQGIKQLTSFGPAGEIIIDYSIHDAIEAGFQKVVFVIRKDLEEDFRQVIGSRIEKHVEVAYAFQEKDDLPEGFVFPEGRKKPWGTGQAILACRDLLHEPFCVINADDYYGKKAYVLIRDYLVEKARRQADHAEQASCLTGEENRAGKGLPAERNRAGETLTGEGKSAGGSSGSFFEVCMAGFVLKNTLSEHGGVTRGLCLQNGEGELTGVQETRGIIRHEGGAAVPGEDGKLRILDPETLVSMNMWGFMPEFTGTLEDRFRDFLKTHTEKGDLLTAEFLLPTIIDQMLKRGEAKVDVLPTDDRWFGVTFHEDIEAVRENFRKLTADGSYPSPLWSF